MINDFGSKILAFFEAGIFSKVLQDAYKMNNRGGEILSAWEQCSNAELRVRLVAFTKEPFKFFCFVTEEILNITAISEDRGSYAKPHATGFP